MFYYSLFLFIMLFIKNLRFKRLLFYNEEMYMMKFKIENNKSK